jgi:hypothetical protein
MIRPLALSCEIRESYQGLRKGLAKNLLNELQRDLRRTSIPQPGDSLKLLGCLLLLSGWLIILAALIMLPGFTQRAAFIGAGTGIEVAGLALLTRGYMATQRGAE